MRSTYIASILKYLPLDSEPEVPVTQIEVKHRGIAKVVIVNRVQA